MMRLRAGMNLAGGRGRVDEVVGARSCEARPAALRRELGVGDRRVSSWCPYRFLGGKKPSSAKLLAAVVISVFFIAALSGSGLSSGKSRRWRF